MNQTGRWATLGITIAMVVAVAGLVTWLRATAPVSPTDTSVENLLPPDDLATCDELEAEEEAGTLFTDQSVGRAQSGTILSCPFLFDGLLVTYVGEVVGDVLRRDGGAWLLVNDDAYALEVGPLTAGGEPRGTNSGVTVWLPEEYLEFVDEPGRQDVRGDVIQVTGRVNRADPADGGGLTIRAEDAELLADAVELAIPVHWNQVVAAVVLAIVALALLWRERERRDL